MGGSRQLYLVVSTQTTLAMSLSNVNTLVSAECLHQRLNLKLGKVYLWVNVKNFGQLPLSDVKNLYFAFNLTTLPGGVGLAPKNDTLIVVMFSRVREDL